MISVSLPIKREEKMLRKIGEEWPKYARIDSTSLRRDHRGQHCRVHRDLSVERSMLMPHKWHTCKAEIRRSRTTAPDSKTSSRATWE